MFYLALLLAKAANLVIRTLNLGAGYTWPGYIALKVDPSILEEFKKRYSTKYILITGTNGKTTTSKLITHILTKENYKVITNKSGANLVNGIVSALLLETNFLKSTKLDYCVLEVDELTLPNILKVFEPKVVLLLNLSRDQLDRYGEVDIIMDKWTTSLKEFTNISVLLNSQQKEFQHLAETYRGPVFYFDNDKEALARTTLVGDYNALNINAAITACGLVGIGKERCFYDLEDFSVAYGRGEVVDYGGISYQIFLAKNPSSFNNNLDLLLSDSINYDALFMVLNDEVRDGRDISWIYDITPEKLKQVCGNKPIYVSGTRYLEMCTRLQYAEVDPSTIHAGGNLDNLIKQIADLEKVKKVVALPNYSAMLEVRKILTGKEIL